MPKLGIYRFFRSYAIEVLTAVTPVAVLVLIIQFTFVRLPFAITLQFLIGLLMVSAGLILFLVGVRIGMLPIGESIGSALSGSGKGYLLIVVAAVLGFVVTVAEPDVRVLANQVDNVAGDVVPRNVFIYAIALGVGIFVGLAMIRVVFRIPIAIILAACYALVFLLVAIAPRDFLSVAFDAGGVTTGPVTVPFILALGAGVASVLQGRSMSDGFGVVALASIGPIIAVLIIGAIYFG